MLPKRAKSELTLPSRVVAAVVDDDVDGGDDDGVVVALGQRSRLELPLEEERMRPPTRTA
jgi:hypothetical protein